ncbi:hypothetical protein KL86SPO_40112 [uncultured Sporomusa sp.]|uniref:Uncharacterized protein n=1 Tax=uncultured Sporomusa sp. TaxID=307249 RepID=A0A212LVT6_9FIRM|nr:hypothetical protein KL86SPO_40112 [uncultured Sporomusa sp.]
MLAVAGGGMTPVECSDCLNECQYQQQPKTELTVANELRIDDLGQVMCRQGIVKQETKP